MTEREQLLAVAASYIDTPYHHGARVKGAGIDCAQFIAAVYEDAGFESPITIPRYMPDWYMHRGDELLLGILTKRALEIAENKVQPADVVVYRFGRCFAHGGIVVAWPKIIHAFRQAKRVIYDIGDQGILAGRERRFFTRTAWAD